MAPVRAMRRLDLRSVYAITVAVLSVLAVLVWIALQQPFAD
jgi:hypothetical protein